MKFFTTLIATLLLAVGSLSAQVVLVNSPEEIAGSYDFSQTDGTWGADLLSDSWTADAEFVDDGVEINTNGCEEVMNDLTGKIALIDRGACAFSAKAFNAQEAGAIGVIIFNNDPEGGLVTMSPSDFADQVTIPVVFLLYEDGQAIRTALEFGPVNITIGNPMYDNNISLNDTSVINAPLGIVPLSQVEGGGFVVNPGAVVSNPGLNAASGITLNAEIQHVSFEGESTEVYSESAPLMSPVDPDTSSGLVVLPAYEPTAGLGQYEINYTITSDSADQFVFDNSLTTNFTVSENLYGRGSWNPNTGNPTVTSAYTIAGGGDIEFFNILNIPNGEGAVIDSVVFYCSTNAASLAGITVESYVYEWNDLNEDTLLTNDELSIAGLAPYTFPAEETATAATLRLPYLDFTTFEETGVPITENNKKYVIGVRYLGEELVFFGFDESYDYTQYQNYQLATGAFTDLDYGYLGVSTFNDLLPDVESAFFFGAVSGAISTGVILSGLPSSTEEVVGPEVFEMEIFPNPATEQITTNIQFKEKTSFVDYRITDASGRLIFNQRDMDVFEKEQAQFNVKQLSAGQYFLTIRTDQGIQSKPFVIKR